MKLTYKERIKSLLDYYKTDENTSGFFSQKFLDLVPILEALQDGKTIEVYSGGNWRDCYAPCFDCEPKQYRVKKENVKVELTHGTAIIYACDKSILLSNSALTKEDVQILKTAVDKF